MAEWFKKMEPLVEADGKALPDAGADVDVVRRKGQSDAWMASCERLLSAYSIPPSKSKPRPTNGGARLVQGERRGRAGDLAERGEDAPSLPDVSGLPNDVLFRARVAVFSGRTDMRAYALSSIAACSGRQKAAMGTPSN